MLASIQHPNIWKAKPELFTGGGNSRGADSTRPHERHHEAPMRETRQAAPDGARASAALSSSESSWFSRGTEPMRRKSYGFVVRSLLAANLITGNIFNKFRRWLQPSRAVRQNSRRPATVPGDENLRAKAPAAAGGSRQERNARASKRATRRSLTRPPPPYHPRRFSSLTRRRAEWLAQRMVIRQKSAEAKNSPHFWLRQEIRDGIAEISSRRSDLVDERHHGDISFAVAALRPVFTVALAI